MFVEIWKLSGNVFVEIWTLSLIYGSLLTDVHYACLRSSFPHSQASLTCSLKLLRSVLAYIADRTLKVMKEVADDQNSLKVFTKSNA